MKKKKYFFLIGFFWLAYVGLFGSTPFINLYWFHPEVRKYIVSSKFSEGECIKSSRWSVNPKRVVGHKEENRNSHYLLKDLDRHEHLQYISKIEVESHGYKASCRI
jgi:hypothetical protein